MEITKTALSLILVMITISTTLTTTIAAAYAGGDNDGGDGNKQKAEDESQAALADCDENDVEQAGFDCIAIAASKIETAEEEPPEGETTLFVCKEVEGNQEVEPGDFAFAIETGPDGNNIFWPGQPPDDCPPVGDEIPGEYEVIEELSPGVPEPDSISVEGGCTQDLTNPLRATGELQEGETETCTFINTYEAGDS